MSFLDFYDDCHENREKAHVFDVDWQVSKAG
jgi:hypothetical protein